MIVKTIKLLHHFTRLESMQSSSINGNNAALYDLYYTSIATEFRHLATGFH